MERAAPYAPRGGPILGPAVQEPIHPAQHLGRGAPGEGDQEYALRPDPALDEMGHAVRESGGLARPGARDDEQRLVAVRRGLSLPIVECVELHGGPRYSGARLCSSVQWHEPPMDRDFTDAVKQAGASSRPEAHSAIDRLDHPGRARRWTAVVAVSSTTGREKPDESAMDCGLDGRGVGSSRRGYRSRGRGGRRSG